MGDPGRSASANATLHCLFELFVLLVSPVVDQSELLSSVSLFGRFCLSRNISCCRKVSSKVQNSINSLQMAEPSCSSRDLSSQKGEELTKLHVEVSVVLHPLSIQRRSDATLKPSEPFKA